MAKISKNISERILMTGDYYLNNHPGGISAVVAYWSRNFENLQYYPIYKNGGKMTKGWWFVTSYLRLAFRMMWDRKIAIVHQHTAADGAVPVLGTKQENRGGDDEPFPVAGHFFQYVQCSSAVSGCVCHDSA